LHGSQVRFTLYSKAICIVKLFNAESMMDAGLALRASNGTPLASERLRKMKRKGSDEWHQRGTQNWRGVTGTIGR
jgi:hypothetical protein